MIPFQISSNRRADMREFLIKYFKFQDYCDNLKERLPSTKYIKFRQLSMQNAASYTKDFKSLLKEIRKFLSDNFDSQVTIFSIGTEIFGSYGGIDDTFFGDTIIALYLQIAYDNSTPITMRDFYKRNLERYGIKYDSYTDYFKNYVYDKPMGEYLNIQARNHNASHPRRYIRNCFPVQQYVLIHSFSKSPYSVSNDTDNPFKMREYVQSLELADFSNDSAIYCFEEKVQRVCDKIYKAILEADKSRYIIRNPKEQQLERQLTVYNIEQAYSYKIYTQIASDVNIIDYFNRLSSFDKRLYKRVSKHIDTVMDCSLLQEIEPIERLYILPEFEYFEDELGLV